MDHAELLLGRVDQHRHSAVYRRHGLAEPARHGRAACQRLQPAGLATADHQRPGLHPAGTLRFPRHSYGRISAAICAGPEAHEDPAKRYTAAVWCGLFYGIAGIFGATLAALFAALPKALILSIAALALFASIIGGLTHAMSEPKEREAALITFLVTASGMTLFSVGSAFWGIVAGLLTLTILNVGKD